MACDTAKNIPASGDTDTHTTSAHTHRQAQLQTHTETNVKTHTLWLESFFGQLALFLRLVLRDSSTFTGVGWSNIGEG